MNEHAPGQAGPAISKLRMEFLVDGIFAIAMTILVLELKVPEIADRHSARELARALGSHGSTFFSYALSFVMLGILWYRHNELFRHVERVTKGMLACQLVQLAAAAFFPFCAALLGRYMINSFSQLCYAGCIAVYLLSSGVQWIMAGRAGAIVPGIDARTYRRIRNRGLIGGTACGVLALIRLVETVMH